MHKKICRVAVAHDWLVAYAGAEIVLENILGLFEHLDLFCIIRDSKNPIFHCDSIANVYSSSLQRIPLIKKNYKFFASLMPRQIERFNFKKYDLVIRDDIENQINDLVDKNEKKNFMEMLNIKQTGLNNLIKKGYNLLSLETFFTSGPEESRAWTITKNCTAPKAAGEIHTDFEKGFIRAETISYDDFIKNEGWVKSKENGKMRLEGKDYIVKDGDVLNFRFNT